MTSFFVLVSILALLAALISGRVKPVYLFSGLVFVYYLTGLIELETMLQNFVNPALITLITLIFVGLVLEKTAFIQNVAKTMDGQTLQGSIVKMGLFVGLSSALLNNTAVVATLLSSIGKKSKHLPSKLLIPLSFIAIFGGTLTLIGTSTHLIINGFVVQAGLPSLSMFDFFYVGIIILVVGTLLLTILAPVLLPAIKRRKQEQKEYFIEAKLAADSTLVGQTVVEAGLRQLEELFLVKVIHSGETIAPVSPNYRLQANDRLMFVGDIKASAKLLLLPGLSLAGTRDSAEMNRFKEVVLSHQSTLTGTTIKEANFRNKFDAAVVAIRRGNEELTGQLADLELKAGDTLVLVTGPDFEKRENLDRNFYFYSSIDVNKQLSQTQSVVAAAGFLSVIALAALEILPLIKGLLILLAFFLISRFITPSELRRRAPIDLFIIIGSALGVATVMMQTGTAAMLADGVMWLFSGWGVWGAFIGIYLLTVLLTELITNNAAAALGFPIALAASMSLDVSAWPFIMAVAYGASASFMTPYGYQTNLMVYSPGGYRFIDYVRIGVPVSFVYGTIVLTAVPIFFPF